MSEDRGEDVATAAIGCAVIIGVLLALAILAGFAVWVWRAALS